MKKKTFKKLSRNPWGLILALFILISADFLFAANLKNIILNKVFGMKSNDYISKEFQTPNVASKATPTISPTPNVIQYKSIPSANNLTSNSSQSWGVAQQTGPDTWSQQLGNDSKMGSPQEIYQALNNYRQVHKVGTLTWNDNLASEAQTRANYFNSIGKIDEHKGLNDFLHSQDGFNKLGFGYIGENSSIGQGPLLGIHIIEWLFAGDQPHNANQLSGDWGYVGIGVSGYAV